MRKAPVGLTKREQRVWATIAIFLRDQGYPPTMREVGTILRLAPSTIHDYFNRLEAKGYLQRIKNSRRALRLVVSYERIEG